MGSHTDAVLETFAAVEERDRDKLFALCHDDVEFHNAPSLPYDTAAILAFLKRAGAPSEAAAA